MYLPFDYNEPVFRPPAEAYSLILQITHGCSWNKCAFCEMYTSKVFKVRPKEDVFKELELLKPYSSQIKKVFLADGDPLVLNTNKLLPILDRIKLTFPRIRRISAYSSSKNLMSKSEFELQELKEAGLDLLYVGFESGSSNILNIINKGETPEMMIENINKAQRVGIEISAMIITGIGGKRFSKEHSIESAKLINEIQPKYLSTLVFTAYNGMDYFKSKLNIDFTELSSKDNLQELKLFIQNLELTSTIFRSDHISNFVSLKGVLGKDKFQLINDLDNAINQF